MEIDKNRQAMEKNRNDDDKKPDEHKYLEEINYKQIFVFLT